MNVKPNDIIVKKNAGELASVYISDDLVKQYIPQLATSDYLRVKARPQYKQSVQPCHRNNSFLPHTGKAWRWAKLNGTFYYDVDTIPDKAPTNYRGMLPTRSELLELKKQAEVVKQSLPIEEFIKPFLHEHYREFLCCYGDCTPVQQNNLAKAAATVQAAIDYIVEEKISLTKNDFFINLSNIIKQLDIRYIPHNYRDLKTKITGAIAGGFCRDNAKDFIKLPRTGNDNALTFDDEEIKSWIWQMRHDGKNFTNAHIIRKLQYMCLISDKPTPSDRWIGRQMEEYSMKWATAIGRFGDTGRMARMARSYTPHKNALYAGDCWQVDGTRVNLIDFKMDVVNKDGVTEKKSVYLYVVAVRDVHSGDVLGYNFDVSENRWTVAAALKMAVEEANYLPYEIVFDKFPGHNTPEMESLFEDLENRGIKVRFTHEAFGKAAQERWFSTLQQVFMQDSEYYYGEGVKSRNRFAHRSKDELVRMKKAAKAEGWNMDKAVEEAGNIIERYRSTKLSYYSRKYKTIDSSPAQLHEKSDKPHVYDVYPHTIAYLFGLRTQKKFEGDGVLNIEIANTQFSYRCADVKVVSNYERVTICYDLNDLSTIHLYEISDKPLKQYLGTASEIDIQLYGPNGDWGKQAKQEAIIADMAEERKRLLTMRIAASGELPLLMGGMVPKHEAEAAETSYLQKEAGHGDADINFDITDQY